MTDEPVATPMAAALGAPGDDRLLLVNCDDLGVTEAANEAVYRCLRDGLATSATLMAPAPAARDAVDRYEGDAVGVHLTLTAEWVATGYRWASLTGASSLHDPQGYLWPTVADVWANASLADVRAECRAQVEQVLSWGIDVTHLDSHMGTMQLRADYHAIYIDLAAEYDLPLRLLGGSMEPVLGFEWRGPARDAGLLSTDHFVVCEVGARDDVRAALGQLRPGLTEIYAHPVVDDPAVRAQLPDWRQRVDDLALLATDPLVPDLLAAAGATTVGYRDLRAAQRGEGAHGAPPGNR